MWNLKKQTYKTKWKQTHRYRKLTVLAKGMDIEGLGKIGENKMNKYKPSVVQ